MPLSRVLRGFLGYKLERKVGKMGCNQCGQCCRTIAGGQKLRTDIFAVENWERIEVPPKMNKYVSDELWKSIFWYKCKLLNKNGSCSIHKNRPNICREYPCENGGYAFLQNVITDKCGFLK
jgi:Fe-S-cluster containining protein